MPKHLMEYFYLIDQSQSFSSRQIDRQIWTVLIILKLSYFRKKDSWKMEVLRIYGFWDQEIDSWFTNHEPLIPTVKNVYMFFV